MSRLRMAGGSDTPQLRWVKEGRFDMKYPQERYDPSGLVSIREIAIHVQTSRPQFCDFRGWLRCWI